MGKLRNLIILVGLYKISHPIYIYSIHYYNNYLRENFENKKNDDRLKEIYNPNQNKWAIITGASEGIGKCFAVDLSKLGFNIVLASRSTEKLQKVQQEIQQINSNSKVEVVSIDLSKETDMSPIVGNKEIMQNLGIIVNNAGQAGFNRVFDQKPEQLYSQHKLNLYAITFLTKYAALSQIQNKEQKRIALIQLASRASDNPIPQLAHYGATKRYDDFFSKLSNQIFKENKQLNKIDTLIVKPGLVTTSMTNFKQVKNFTSFPEEVSHDSLRDLGNVLSTYGSMAHNLQRMIYYYIPYCIIHQKKKDLGKQAESFDKLFLQKK